LKLSRINKDFQLSGCARAKARARIETSIFLFSAAASVVAPARKRGRGLKQPRRVTIGIAGGLRPRESAGEG
jgi:hypothetical protein